VRCGVRLLGVLLDLDGYPYTRFDGVDFVALKMEGWMQAAFAVCVSGEEPGARLFAAYSNLENTQMEGVGPRRQSRKGN
jgi:hypothetical protein